MAISRKCDKTCKHRKGTYCTFYRYEIKEEDNIICESYRYKEA